MKHFFSFLKEQGLALAIGFIMGTSVSKVMTSLVDDIIDPLSGVMLGHEAALKEAFFQIGTVKIHWGNFANTTLEFLAIALVVYAVVRIFNICPPGKNCDQKKST